MIIVEAKQVQVYYCIQIKGSIKYRYGTIYREILRIEFDLCSILDGVANTVGQVFLAIVKDSFPSVLRKCPLPAVSLALTNSSLHNLNCLFKEEVDMKNITFNDNSWPSVIPSGIYRAEITFKGVMELQIESNFWSDIKTSF